MGKFQGYLIRFPKTNKTFPDELIGKEQYKCTPLQRTEIKAKRDDNNLLQRTTSPNHKTFIEITTIDGISLSQWRKIRNIIFNAMINYDQRKLRVEYWDDEKLAYRTMTAYIPDITYTPKTITTNDIKYKAITINFIEY
jgi:hypothetical protein